MEREKLEKNIAAIRVAPNEAEVGKYTDAILIDIEQYANKRVIDELDRIEYDYVLERRKEGMSILQTRIYQLKLKQ
jgi:hypothetical protein